MSVGDISTQLLVDWVPSLPAAVSSSFIGWPPFLLQTANLNGDSVLALRAAVGQSERQWKSVLSWMLGVASARHVLGSESYRWIAPLSAFYPGGVQPVDLSVWHPFFPRSSVTVTRSPGNRSRVRPDYLALRSTTSAQSGGTYEWAIAEAKGCQIPVAKVQTCPTGWSNQARNVIVTVCGSQITIPRHLVIATRVNANGARPAARRLQVRAWNRSDEPKEPQLQSEAAVDIVAAHLFGLFRGLGLRENARAIALSVQARTESREGHLFPLTREHVYRATELAKYELQERSQNSSSDEPTTTLMPIQTELGPLLIDLAEPVIKLARNLGRAENQEAAAAALREADSTLDTWGSSSRKTGSEHGKTTLPFGVEVGLPRDFEPR